MPTGAKRAGISGLAVAIAATGGYLVYSGIRNVSPLAGLRDLARGKLPAGQAPVVTAVTFTEAMGPADPGAAGSGGGGVLGTARCDNQQPIAVLRRHLVRVHFIRQLYRPHEPPCRPLAAVHSLRRELA